MIDNQKKQIQLVDCGLRLMANFIPMYSNMRHNVYCFCNEEEKILTRVCSKFTSSCLVV